MSTRTKKKAELKEFEFKGSAELSGVRFFIRAQSLEEAKAKAARGEWDDDDARGASWVNWEIDPHSGKDNK